MTYLFVKSFHIVFMVAWYAGLFYLPRLFVYHAMETNPETVERFKVMERRLYYGIMLPSMVLTLVAVLVVLHFYLGKLMADFKADRNAHGHVFYRWLNEIPALPVLIVVVLLVVIKPSW
jgi:protoporphyrinogen IX oxidase